MQYKENMKFTKNGFFIGCLLFVVHVLIYDGVIGPIFATSKGTMLFFYLSICIWASAFLTSILSDLEQDIKFIFRGASFLVIFLFGPIIYLWVKKV